MVLRQACAPVTGGAAASEGTSAKNSMQGRELQKAKGCPWKCCIRWVAAGRRGICNAHPPPTTLCCSNRHVLGAECQSGRAASVMAMCNGCWDVAYLPSVWQCGGVAHNCAQSGGKDVRRAQIPSQCATPLGWFVMWTLQHKAKGAFGSVFATHRFCTTKVILSYVHSCNA